MVLAGASAGKAVEATEKVEVEEVTEVTGEGTEVAAATEMERGSAAAAG